jgi:hypothetical protein
VLAAEEAGWETEEEGAGKKGREKQRPEQKNDFLTLPKTTKTTRILLLPHAF